MTSQLDTDDREVMLSATGGSPHRSTSTFARYGLTTLDVLLCFAVLIVMCAYTPFFHTWFWAPRMAVVLAVVLPGLIALVRLVANGDRAARWGAGFLVWALVAAAFSDNWWLSFRGTIAQSTFVLTFMAALGLWALAQSMSPAGRRLMLRTVLVGVTLNAIVGALQVLLQLEGGNLGLLGGRAIGLTPNPIELAAYMLIGIFVCLQMWTDDASRRVELAVVGVFSFGAVLAFTSTRVALVAFVVVAVAANLQRRDRRLLQGSLMATLGVACGVGISRIAGNGTDVLGRATASAGGRTEWWVAGAKALADRPVTGWGLGRFRPAIQGELTFAQVAANQDSQAIPDAHNLMVSMAVEVGVIGLVLFLGFCWCVARRVSGVYSLALLAVPIIWLLQPVAQTTMLVFVVMLGIAVSPARSTAESEAFARGTSAWTTWMWATATIVGVCAASWLMVAEYRLAQASLALDGAKFAAAEAMYFGDPLVSDVGARILTGRSLVDQTVEPQILPQLERSADLEPTRAYFQARVAAELGRLGEYRRAEQRARRALELQPTSALAWTTLRNIAEETDDERLRLEASGPLCLLGLDGCAS
ncbi:MAG TPA: O-antigen ligase family protein [Ilumatobacteraceae bacterium]|nr:O-antigen ligase family protein [Ilumatobacteraceae bacterium]